MLYTPLASRFTTVYNTSYEGQLLFDDRQPFLDGSFVAMKGWEVPPSPQKPEGFRYSLAYIDANGNRVLGYDNAKGKGYHRHEGSRETLMTFTTIDDLVKRFLNEVKAMRRAKP